MKRIPYRALMSLFVPAGTAALAQTSALSVEEARTIVAPLLRGAQRTGEERCREAPREGHQSGIFDGETQLFPGLRSIPGYGHTPGQSYYVLESEGERMIFWGDIIHVPDIQFYNPDITIKFDVDSTAAAARRKRDFADAAKNRTLVAMPHMYFPGVGHVAKEGNHYRWLPLPYVNDAKPVVSESKRSQ